jgi:ADP-ribosyl-[dinitrogen reductase] hydrolase
MGNWFIAGFKRSDESLKMEGNQFIGICINGSQGPAIKSKEMTREQVYGALFGVAIGDALGVPAEFKDRAFLKQNPVTDFEGYKSHNQPPGTFSDDSSLTFCLAASLCNGYNLQDIGGRFVQWHDKGYWTAGGDVFDIGMTTSRAIGRLKKGIRADLAGDFDEGTNGNGSLMRILPLLFYIKGFDIEKRWEVLKEVSSITHGHIRSVVACFYYLEFALCLLQGQNKQQAYTATAERVAAFIKGKEIIQKEIDLFAPLLAADITKESIDNIPSFGYVMNTLKASMYCFMITDNYKDAVLMAVNLGNDSDTTAAVTGGLAGLYYGYESIPAHWRSGIRRKADIIDLCELFLISLA